MKITDVVKRKGKKTCDIFVDGEYFCSLEYELILHNNLTIGREIEREHIINIRDESDRRKAFDQSLNYLSYRMRTELEVFDYLKKKQFPQYIIDETIEKLKQYKYIDDESYLELYIGSKKREGHSRRKISYNLIKKGLSEQQISQVIEHLYSEQEEFIQLEEQIRKAATKYRNLPYRDKVAKLSRSFLTKGFKRDDIINIVRNTVANESESDEFINRLEKLATKYRAKHEKKGYDAWITRQKVIQSLYRKGYDLDSINKILNKLKS